MICQSREGTLEHRVDAIEGFELSSDRTLIRMMFKQGKKKFHVDVPALEFAAALTMVSKAVASITSEGLRAVIDVADAEAGRDEDGIQVELTNLLGAPMNFGLGDDAARRLHAGLGRALQGRTAAKKN